MCIPPADSSPPCRDIRRWESIVRLDDVTAAHFLSRGESAERAARRTCIRTPQSKRTSADARAAALARTRRHTRHPSKARARRRLHGRLRQMTPTRQCEDAEVRSVTSCAAPVTHRGVQALLRVAAAARAGPTDVVRRCSHARKRLHAARQAAVSAQRVSCSAGTQSRQTEEAVSQPCCGEAPRIGCGARRGGFIAALLRELAGQCGKARTSVASCSSSRAPRSSSNLGVTRARTRSVRAPEACFLLAKQHSGAPLNGESDLEIGGGTGLYF